MSSCLKSESEFKIIRPQRASSKQRLYRRVDVENILTIKKLLYEDGYTVPGARKLLTAKKTFALSLLFSSSILSSAISPLMFGFLIDQGYDITTLLSWGVYYAGTIWLVAIPISQNLREKENL